MIRYKNLGGNSAVFSYEIEADSITVKFDTGATYLYTYRIPGAVVVEQMKALAIQGRGLNSYINSVVKIRYQSKLR
jgi:hypothetical protein